MLLYEKSIAEVAAADKRFPLTFCRSPFWENAWQNVGKLLTIKAFLFATMVSTVKDVETYHSRMGIWKCSKETKILHQPGKN